MGQVAGVYRKSRVTKNHRVQKRRMTVKGTPEREVHQGKRTKAFCKADSENLARRTEKGVQKKNLAGNSDGAANTARQAPKFTKKTVGVRGSPSSVQPRSCQKACFFETCVREPTNDATSTVVQFRLVSCVFRNSYPKSRTPLHPLLKPSGYVAGSQ